MRLRTWLWLWSWFVALIAPSGVSAACPKVLMFDGVDIKSQTDTVNARYWGREIGVQGFFLNNVMPTWQDDVGEDRASPAWTTAQRFQSLYRDQGVTDNFIKVAIWRRHAWNDSTANAAVVQHFAHAAELARFAGFKGVAMDTEPYAPIWGGDAGGAELAPVVEEEGKAIGAAMRNAYPEMTLVLIGDPLYWAGQGMGYHGGYGLALPFLKGLLSSGFDRVIAADELTYTEHDIVGTVNAVRAGYTDFFETSQLHVKGFDIAAGLWPLGASYHDKSARIAPDEFARELQGASRSGGRYTWIYGFGSAWQKDGPNRRTEPLAANFDAYAEALHDARRACER